MKRDLLKGFSRAATVFLAALICLGTVWKPTAAQGSTTALIALVVNDSSPYQFGRYLGEILRAEGISSFEIIPIGELSSASLANRDLLILAETPLSSSQAAIINAYYGAGGQLLAMRPDAPIRGLFGLGSSAGTLDSAYLRVVNGAVVNGEAPGLGITSETMQYHGVASLYNVLPGTVTVAQLYSDAETPTSFPAVVSTPDGRAVAFTYDLARSVVLTRQGNPSYADADNDGDGLIRARDLFLSPTGNHWIDRNKIPIPQADEQQRLMARLVRQAVENVRPLPRLWYFPGTARTILIPTSDAHANPLTWYQTLIDAIEAHNATITIYLSIGAPDNATVQGWRSRGHTFGLHPYAYAPNFFPPFNIESLAEGYYVYDNWYRDTYFSPPSRSVRNHNLAWVGWTEAAEIAASYNLRLDTNFFTSGAWLQRPDGTWPHGYLTGSGQPMRMVRADGTILNYFQQLTQLVDVQMVCSSRFENLTNAQAVLVSRELIDRSQTGDYAALMAIFHVDCVGEIVEWINGTLAYARSQGVPIWNADRWTDFVETRYAAQYSNIVWDLATSTLTFNLTAPTSSYDLTTIIPRRYLGGNLISVSVDGTPASFSVQTIKGRDEAFIVVPAGNHSFTAVYEPGYPQIPTAVAPADGFRTTNPRPTFSWLPAQGAARYEIQVGTDNSPQGTIYSVPHTPGQSLINFVLPFPLQTTTYFWHIRSINGADRPSNWNATRALFIDSAPNAAPARNRYTTATPRLSWGRITGAIGYEVQVSSNSAFTGTLAFRAEVGANELDIVTSPLANGTYFWRVRARRSADTWGAWSSTDSFLVDVP